jgi:hypothetical protein
LDARDTGFVEELFVETEKSPQMVRALQGNVGFRFPGQDERGSELWFDPDLLAWGKLVCERVPHVLYYLCPEPWAGAMALACICCATSEQLAAAAAEEPNADAFELLLPLLCERLLAAASFAERMADDWHPIVTELVAPFDPETAGSILGTVEGSLSLAVGQ